LERINIESEEKLKKASSNVRRDYENKESFVWFGPG